MRRYGTSGTPRPTKLVSEEHGFLAKRVDVKIFVPGHRLIHHISKARPGHYINETGIERLLEQEERQLSARLPGYDFRLVELAPDRFNLVGELKEPERSPVSEILERARELAREAV